jgi:hypothetical protein
VIQVDAEVIGRKDCVGYIGKLEGILANQSYKSWKWIQGLYESLP